MRFIKYLSLFLSLTLLLGIMAACNNGNGGSITTESPSTESTESPESTGASTNTTEAASSSDGTTEATEGSTTAEATTDNSDTTSNTTEATTEATTVTTEITETTEATETTEGPYKTLEITERYFIYRMWNFDVTSMREFQKIVDTAKEDGFNAIKIHIPWNHVEKTEGVYDYGIFDDMVDYVVNDQRMKVAISIDLTRVKDDGLLSEDDFMRNIDGNLSMGGMNNGTRMQISFNSERAVSMAVAFYRDAVARYDKLYGDDILFYIPAFSQYAETEYYPINNGYDYSEVALDAYREFLKENYQSIDNLNGALGTDYVTFEEIVPPSTSTSTPLGHTWYVFRHNSLKTVIDRLAAAHKEVSPDSKIGVQFGCVWSSEYMRATACFAALCENVDVVWVDDGPTMNHRFSMDYLRAALPTHIELAQEIDGPLQTGASQENYLRQGLECFERGCTYVSIANWHIDSNYEKYRACWQEIADTWLGKKTPEIVNPSENSPVINVSLLELFRQNNMGSIMDYYNSLAPNGEFVIINIVDDLSTTLPGKSDIYNLHKNDFGSVQGKNNWYYKSYLDGEFTKLTYSNSSNAWEDESGNKIIDKSKVYATDGTIPALIYKAPESGTVTFSVTCKPSSKNAANVTLLVMKNGELVKDENGNDLTVTVTSGKTYYTRLSIELAEEDELAFIVSAPFESEESLTYTSNLSVYLEYVK